MEPLIQIKDSKMMTNGEGVSVVADRMDYGIVKLSKARVVKNDGPQRRNLACVIDVYLMDTWAAIVQEAEYAISMDVLTVTIGCYMQINQVRVQHKCINQVHHSHRTRQHISLQINNGMEHIRKVANTHPT